VSHAEQVALLIDGGASLIQLREKTDPAAKFFAQAEQALGIARRRGAKIVINDRVDLALALGADGVHLGQEDLAPDAARRILGDDAIIGFSTHNLEQALLAAQMPVDYVAIGPIFSTTTKRSPNPPVGLDGLARVRDALGAISIVAIGGVTSENIEATLKAGADAAAIIADIWGSALKASIKTGQLLKLS
jgi:thiamine-phosphate pyrophosphorylase